MTLQRTGNGWIPAWQRDSACLSTPELPWAGERPSDVDQYQMAQVCAGCPVIAECAALADLTKADAGFWAGHDRTPPRATPRPADMPWLDATTGHTAMAKSRRRRSVRPVPVEQLQLGITVGAGAA
ncbi:MAG: WhiB family transcriptional regulator [Ornithinimicrobium sp.]